MNYASDSSKSVGYSSSCSYSGLENIAKNYSASSQYSGKDISYMIDAVPQQDSGFRFYEPDGNKNPYQTNDYNRSNSKTKGYSFIPDDFLAPNRPKTAFIGSAREIKEFVEEAFLAVTGREFPDDVLIHVLDEKEFRKAHSHFGDKWNLGIQGFAINRKKIGLVSEIFVKKGELDKIMLAVGHELGHVLTRKLDNAINEEAKAFAFSIAWMKKIKELNIANLSTAIRLDKPAKNGLHNVALDFVLGLVEKGREALDIYFDLVKGFIK